MHSCWPGSSKLTVIGRVKWQGMVATEGLRHAMQGNEFCQKPHKLGKGPQASDETAAAAKTFILYLWDPKQRT